MAVSVTALTDSLSPSWLIKRQQAAHMRRGELTAKTEGFLLRKKPAKNIHKQNPAKAHKQFPTKHTNTTKPTHSDPTLLIALQSHNRAKKAQITAI